MAIYPNQVFTQSNVTLCWEERYTSEALNRKFLGIPRGVYAGFRPQVSPLYPTKLDLTPEPGDGYSLIRVQASSEPVMLDIITSQTVTLDFTGHSTWPVYVVAQADFQVGTPTSGRLITQNLPATTPQQVTVCKVDRPGNVGPIIVYPTAVFPTNDIVSRQEPYAFGNTTTLELSSVVGLPAINDIATCGGFTSTVVRVSPLSVDVVLITPEGLFPTGAVTFAPSGASATITKATKNSTAQRFGFMPEASKERLDVAYSTAQEVVASRIDMGQALAPVFDPTNPTTTGLPARLSQDLRAAGMSSRLGLRSTNIRSNVYTNPFYSTVDITFAAHSLLQGDLISGTGASVGALGYITTVNGTTITVNNLNSTAFTSGGVTWVGHVGGGPSGSGVGVAITSVKLKNLNISGSFSAKRRASLNNFPFTDYTNAPLTPRGRSVINPSGSEDTNPGSGTVHAAVEGAISATSIQTNILTINNPADLGGKLNSVDAFLPGEVVIGYDVTPVEVGRMVVSDQRSPYLVGTLLSGNLATATTVLGTYTGATASVTAVTTSSTLNDTVRNTGFIINATTGEKFTIPNTVSGETDVVFGRVSFDLQDQLPGTLTFSQTFPTVLTSADLRGTVAQGDILLAPDGRYYEITAPITFNQITLQDAYVGASTLPTSNIVRRKINLNLVTRSLPVGTEQATPITWSLTSPPLQFFFPVWTSDRDSIYDANLEMITNGEPYLPTATTTIKGKVLLASDGGTTAATVVQGNDSRLQGLTARANSGAALNPHRKINFLGGGVATIAIAETGINPGDEITVTITAAGSTAVSFPGSGAATVSDGGLANNVSGSSGGGDANSTSQTTAVNHFHPLSKAYAIHSSVTRTATTANFSIPTTFTPRILLNFSSAATGGGQAISIGAATATAQSCLSLGNNGDPYPPDGSGVIATDGGGTSWTSNFSVASPTSGTVSMSTSGANAFTHISLIIGDILGN